MLENLERRNKTILAGLCYGYRDGPLWGTLIRIGFDPRKDAESYKYAAISMSF